MDDRTLAALYLESLACCGPAADVDEAFVHHVNERLYHPMMAPLYLRPGARLEHAALARVDRRLRETLPRGPLAAPAPYFSILALDGAYPVDVVAASAREAGWVLDPSQTLNAWTAPVAARLDPRYVEETLPVGGPSVRARLHAIGRQAFGMAPEVADAVERAMDQLLASHDGPGYAVFLTRDGNDCAAGVALVTGEAALLLGGAVLPEHRSLGLWRRLVAARQRATAANWVRAWFMTTRNERIAGKADRSCRILTFYNPVTMRPVEERTA